MLRFLRPLRIGDVHADAVDLHALVGGDEDVAPAVDDAGLDHVAVLRRDGDLHLWRGDLELAAVDDVLRVQRHILTVLPAALLLERLRLFLGYAAVGQHIAHLADGQRQHLGVMALLVLCDTLTQLLVDGLHHVVAALLLEGIAQRRAEHVLLLLGGHRRLRAEHRVDHLLMELGGVPAVKEGVVDVGGTVVEGGEQEAQLRRQRDMAGGGAVEAAVLAAVFQLQRGGLHRTDAAHEVLIHRVRPLGKRLVIPALIGHVVGVRRQQDEVVGLAHVQGVDDAAVQRLAGVLIPGVRLADGLQQAVLIAVRHLRGGEYDVHQVPPQCAGQGFLQKSQIHLLLLLGHEAHGGVHVGDDLLVAVDIAAVDLAECVFVQLEAPANFVEFFLIHSVSVRCVCFWKGCSRYRCCG